MPRLFRAWAAVFIMAASGGQAAKAEDLALIIANHDYLYHAPVPAERAIRGLSRPLANAGYRVETLTGTRRGFSAAQAEAIYARLQAADRLIVVVAGHVVHAGGQNWLLHTDAQQVTGLTVGAQAVALQPFYEFARQRAGDALIVLADAPVKVETGSGAADGPTSRGVPQGVTLVTGAPGRVAPFLVGTLLQPGLPVAEAAGAAENGIRMHGYLPRFRSIVSRQAAAPDPQAIERAYWQRVREQNTAEAYAGYLERYPNGLFAGEARQREAALTLTPLDRARLAEEALGLSREQRRQIQRQLTLLGYDTRGVDGLLGRNSRNAIGTWQRSIGVQVSGFLTANQITRLETAAAIRAEELRIEAERRRLEAERRDQQYWGQTGASGSEAGLRAYLQRYPDGLYSQDAKSRLGAIERERRRQAQAAERQMWDQVTQANSATSYETYLTSYPNGLFADEARARIQALREPETPPEVIAAAKREEERLSLNGFTRQLIEAQLRALRLDPGKVDGRFTDKTRKALRNYQRATEQPVTGYVTRDTVVLLLASATQ